MIRQLTLQLLIILAVGSLPFHRSLKGPYISVGGGFLVSPAVAQNITSTNDTVADETTLLEQCDTAQRNINLLAWSQTDFNRCTVRLDEIISGGLGKDGIPSIDNPMIIAADRAGDLTPKGPVISLSINGEARAWPLRYLIWHEIVNDELGGVPIAVTYCPLCNATLVFDRRLDGQVLDFGTTGNLRKSDLVMYDRQTESWWQQYTGTDIIGTHAGRSLTVLASRLESWQQFSLRHPGGSTMIPAEPFQRPYGINPYQGYDTSSFPFLYDGEVPEGIRPLDYVVVTGGKAWSLKLMQEKRIIRDQGTTIEWQPGQRSALDTRMLADGRDIGMVTVTRDGADIPYEVTFAFVFHAFTPDGEIIKQ